MFGLKFRFSVLQTVLQRVIYEDDTMGGFGTSDQTEQFVSEAFNIVETIEDDDFGVVDKLVDLGP